MKPSTPDEIKQTAVASSSKDPNQNTFASPDQARGGLSKLKDATQAHEILEIAKNVPVPQARFGHTITMVNKYKVVLFGGATGDTGKYSMTGETFIFNMFLKTWTELNVKGVPPSPRAAHASTNVE